MDTNIQIFGDCKSTLTIRIINPNSGIRHAVLDLSLIDSDNNLFFLNRLFVSDDMRNKGAGKKLLDTMKEMLKKDCMGGKVIVTPGGYGSDLDELIRFYTKNGFELIEDEVNGYFMQYLF